MLSKQRPQHPELVRLQGCRTRPELAGMGGPALHSFGGRDPRPGLPFPRGLSVRPGRDPRQGPSRPAGSIPIGSSGEYGRRGHLLRQVQCGPEGAAALAHQVWTWRTAGHARKLKITYCTWRLVGKNTGGFGRAPRGTGEGDRRGVSTPRPQLLSGSYNLGPVSGKTWPRDTSERVRLESSCRTDLICKSSV